MSNIQNGPFIVTGASGQLGRQVVDLLVQAGAGPVIAISRTPDKLADLKEKGVEVLGHVDEGYGKFAWILDPDGVKIELWEQREAPD